MGRVRDFLFGEDIDQRADERILIEAEVEPEVGAESASEDELRTLREAVEDYRVRMRDAERLAYEVLDGWPVDKREMKPRDRRRIVAEAGEAWQRDPQAGAAVDLMNDFVLGRGVPRPRFRDPRVQAEVDAAWDDPDNELALTGLPAQFAFGTDLSLQCNVFFLVFDDGDDGIVKLGILDHDSVEAAIPDPENRLRVLHYMSRERVLDWDYEHDKIKQTDIASKPKVIYYEHWRNVDDARELGDAPPEPPENKLGFGRVYHVAINRRQEQHFGVPTMRRLLRWFSAYNEFMTARVDLAKAAAAFLMKRKVRGGPTRVQQLAHQVMNRTSELAQQMDPEIDPMAGPRPGSILNENEAVSHEPFTLNTNAGQAMQDGSMLQGQIAAASHFPTTYLGAEPGSLAGATAVELPVLKAVEARQEVVEATYRWFIDLVITRAQEAGRLPYPAEPGELQEQDAQEGIVDLSYEFSLPNPQRRMMGELVSAVANIAKTFDPNGTNIELSRTLLAIAFGQGLEMENPADAVTRVFPPGYVDPVSQALQQQGGPPAGPPIGQTPQGQVPSPTNVGFPGPNGRQHSEDNPYGAKRKGQYPEDNVTRYMAQARVVDLPDTVKMRAREVGGELEELFDSEVMAAAEESLSQLEATLAANGSGNGKAH